MNIERIQKLKKDFDRCKAAVVEARERQARYKSLAASAASDEVDAENGRYDAECALSREIGILV